MFAKMIPALCFLVVFLIQPAIGQVVPGTSVSGNTTDWILNLEQSGGGTVLQLGRRGGGSLLSGITIGPPPLSARITSFSIGENDAFFRGNVAVRSLRLGLGEFNIDAPGIPGGRLKVLDNGAIGVGTIFPNAKFHVRAEPGAYAIMGVGGYGIIGESSGSISWAGVRGFNSSTGFGVWGQSQEGIGIMGSSTNGVAGRFAGGGDLLQGVGREGLTVFQVASDGTTTTKILKITGGADLSENFSVIDERVNEDIISAMPLVPGMLVSIDPQKPGALAVSTKAYDRLVAGVLSGAGGVEPGVILDQESEKSAIQRPVALIGRVYTLADASVYPIEPGDLLTTSETPGHAMKVIDHPKAQGAIVGKAMTGLNGGRGLILVLMTLQ
jgi:hypothetical protein